MDEQQHKIQGHLNNAMKELEQALAASIKSLKEDPQTKQQIGTLWENFLGSFFGQIREKGKENKINLLSLISFPSLKKK